LQIAAGGRPLHGPSPGLPLVVFEDTANTFLVPTRGESPKSDREIRHTESPGGIPPEELGVSLVGPTSKHIGAVDAVFAGCVFLFRATETVEPGRYANAFKPQRLQERYELCLRQGAGDSTGP
jgi:hypothetical protein